MVNKCKKCGYKIIKYPVYEGQEEDNSFDAKGKTIIWKNFFKIDLMTLLFIVIVGAMVFAYQADVAKCDEVIKDPVKFCGESNACAQWQYDQDNRLFRIEIPGISNQSLP